MVKNPTIKKKHGVDKGILTNGSTWRIFPVNHDLWRFLVLDKYIIKYFKSAHTYFWFVNYSMFSQICRTHPVAIWRNKEERRRTYNMCCKNFEYMLQCGAPKIAKLMQITPITMVYGTQITIVMGVYKPTNITGEPPYARSIFRNGNNHPGLG